MLLWDTFFAAGEGQLAKGSFIKAEELLKSALSEANSFAEDDVRLLQSRLALVAVYQKCDRFPEADTFLQSAGEQIGRFRTFPPSLRASVLEARMVQVSHQKSDPRAPIEIAMELVELWEDAGADHLPSLTKSLLRLAKLHQDLAEEDSVRAALERALELTQQDKGVESVESADLLSELAQSHLRSAQFELAERRGREALSVREAALGANHQTLAGSWFFLAKVLVSLKRHDDALSAAERAEDLAVEEKPLYQLEYVEMLYGHGHWQTALSVLLSVDPAEVPADLSSRFQLARVRVLRGLADFEGAKTEAQRLSKSSAAAKSARLEAFVVLAELGLNDGKENPSQYFEPIMELADAEIDHDGPLLTRIADYAEAIEQRAVAEGFYDRGIAARSEALDPSDPESVNVLVELGEIQERRRLLPEAVTSWERALESLRRHGGRVDGPAQERRLRMTLVRRLAEVYVRQRRWERAEQAWRSLVRSSPPLSPDHVVGRLGLANVYLEQEQYPKAQEMLELEGIVVTEAEYGREVFDRDFLLRLQVLANTRQLDSARDALDQRFGERGAAHLTSVRELFAAVVYASCADDEELLNEVSEELMSRQPQDVDETLLMSRFFVLMSQVVGKPGENEFSVKLDPVQALTEAIVWAVEANGESDLRVAELLEDKARAAVRQGAWETGEEATRQSLALRSRLQGEKSITMLASLQRLGELQLGRGRLEEASLTLEQALELAQLHLAPQDSAVREILRSLVEAYRRLAEFGKAREHLFRLLSLYERFSELRPEEKLDDLLRGIRLLLGDEADHQLLLSDYLDEATELALLRKEIAAPSLAFCLGQKARLLLKDHPDQAIGFLRRQATTLEQREEAREFIGDQILLGRLFLYRGQPQSVLTLLLELEAIRSFSKERMQTQISAKLLEAKSYFMLEQYASASETLDWLERYLHSDQMPSDWHRADILALQLALYAQDSKLVDEESVTRAYADLDRLSVELEWTQNMAPHELRERWSWELSRLRFEIDRLAPSAALERMVAHAAKMRGGPYQSSAGLADVLALMASLEEAMELEEEALSHLDFALKLTEESGDAESLGRARMLGSFARLAERQGHPETALGAYREAVGDLKTHLGSRHQDMVPLYLGLGRLHSADGDLQAAESALRAAMAIVEEVGDTVGFSQRCEVLASLAELARLDGRLDVSTTLWKKLETSYAEIGELLPTEWLESYLQVQLDSGMDAEALAYFLDGLPFRLGQDHDLTLLRLYTQWLEKVLHSPDSSTRNERAELLLEFRELVAAVADSTPESDEAVSWASMLVACARMDLLGLANGNGSGQGDLRQALAFREEFVGMDSSQVGEVLQLQAQFYRRENDLVAAEKCLTRALNISETQDGQETWEVADILLNLAHVYFKKQKLSPTEAVLQRTLEICRALLEDHDRRWIEVCHLKGKLSLELGRPVEAYDSLTRALKLSSVHAEPVGRSLLVAAGKANLLTERREEALELFQQAEPMFEEAIQDWDQETEDVVLTLGELHLAKGHFQEAEDRLVRVLALQEQRYGFGDPRLARAYRNLGISATGLNELDTAEERLEIALAFQEESLFSPTDLFAPYVALINAHRDQGREERAESLLLDNLDRCREAERSEEVAQLSDLLARSYEARGDIKGAEAAWKEAVEAWDESVTQASDETSSQRCLAEQLAALRPLGKLLTDHLRFTEAEEVAKRRLKITEMLDLDESAVSEVLFDLAELYRVQGLYRASDELHQRVLATRAAELGRSHPEVARSVRALGQIYLGEGKLEQAVSYLERALEQQKTALGVQHPDVAETLFALGETSIAQEDFTSAESFYRQALELLESHFGSKDVRTARAWASLAGLYEQKQQWSQAQPLLGKAVESVEAVLGTSHLEVAALLEKTVEIYLLSGAWDEVLLPLERVIEIRIEKLGEHHPSVARAYRLSGDHSLLTGNLAAARRLFGKADQIISEYHGAQSVERIPYRLSLASSLRQLDEYEQAYSHLHTLLHSEAINSHSQKELMKADVLDELARLELGRGKLTPAEDYSKQTLEIRNRLLGPQTEGVAQALETLAGIHRCDGRTITASALAERALEARAGVQSQGAEGKATSVLGRARVFTLLARLELDQGSCVKANEFAHEALHLRRDLLGESHPEVASNLHLLGEIAVVERRLEKAESYFEQALERWESFFGGAHPQVFQAVTSLALLFSQQGRLTLAEQYHQRNLVALEGRYGADHPILAETLMGLGQLSRSQGISELAETYLKRAVELLTSVHGDSDPKVANALHSLALVYHDQRNFLAAEALLKKAQQIRRESSGGDSAELTESYLALARLYRSSGKSADAEPLLKNVLEWRSRRFGEDHPEVASALREMADVYADQKQYLKAQALVRRSIEIYGTALGQRNLEIVGPLRQLVRFLEAAGEPEEAEVQRRLIQDLMGSV